MMNDMNIENDNYFCLNTKFGDDEGDKEVI